MNPVLLAQGKDEYYAASGREFVAYSNYKTSEEQYGKAGEQLQEVREDLPEVE